MATGSFISAKPFRPGSHAILWTDSMTIPLQRASGKPVWMKPSIRLVEKFFSLGIFFVRKNEDVVNPMFNLKVSKVNVYMFTLLQK